MVNKETIFKIKQALRIGDQAEIARLANLSRPAVNQILSSKRGNYIGGNQELVVNIALDIIARRQKAAEKLTKKINDLLG